MLRYVIFRKSKFLDHFLLINSDNDAQMKTSFDDIQISTRFTRGIYGVAVSVSKNRSTPLIPRHSSASDLFRAIGDANNNKSGVRRVKAEGELGRVLLTV